MIWTIYRIYVKNYIVFYVVIDDIMEVRRLLYNRKKYKEWVMILRKMTKLKDGDKAVQDIVKNWKIMYSKRKAMMEELERL